MSVTNTNTEVASDFIGEVSKDPELKKLVSEQGLEEAANRAGYDLDKTEMEIAIKEFVKQDLPTDGLETDSNGISGLSAHSGCSRCCS